MELCLKKVEDGRGAIKEMDIDIEIENRLTVIRRERGGDNRGKGLRVYRNNYKGHMDNKKGGGGNGGGRWGGLG